MRIQIAYLTSSGPSSRLTWSKVRDMGKLAQHSSESDTITYSKQRRQKRTSLCGRSYQVSSKTDRDNRHRRIANLWSCNSIAPRDLTFFKRLLSLCKAWNGRTLPYTTDPPQETLKASIHLSLKLSTTKSPALLCSNSWSLQDIISRQTISTSWWRTTKRDTGHGSLYLSSSTRTVRRSRTSTSGPWHQRLSRESINLSWNSGRKCGFVVWKDCSWFDGLDAGWRALILQILSVILVDVEVHVLSVLKKSISCHPQRWSAGASCNQLRLYYVCLVAIFLCLCVRFILRPIHKKGHKLCERVEYVAVSAFRPLACNTT